MIFVNLIPGPRKRCTKCGNMVPLWHFTRHSGCSDGLNTYCKSCKSKAWKERYARDRDKLIAYQKQYYRDNAEKVKAYHRERYAYDEAYRVMCKSDAASRRDEWRRRRRKNPITNLADRLRVRLKFILKSKGHKKKSATFDKLGYTQTDLWKHLRSYLGSPCELCGFMLSLQNAEIDHIVPLATATTEDDVWELNKLNNLRLICFDCNRRRPSDGSDLEDQNV